ncbi:hypothetical protein KM043_006129 [Ampulex compressa]|nr:hypothetical protein KM043_006129 [Ampulex compressa]
MDPHRLDKVAFPSNNDHNNNSAASKFIAELHCPLIWWARNKGPRGVSAYERGLMSGSAERSTERIIKRLVSRWLEGNLSRSISIMRSRGDRRAIALLARSDFRWEDRGEAEERDERGPIVVNAR